MKNNRGKDERRARERVSERFRAKGWIRACVTGSLSGFLVEGLARERWGRGGSDSKGG